MLNLNAEIDALKGVGPALKTKLNNRGVRSIEDILFLLPNRYEDRTILYDIQNAPINEHVLIAGKIIESKILFYGRRSLFVKIQDDSAVLNLRFFYFSRSQLQQFKKNTHLICFGLLKSNGKKFEMIHPEYRFIESSKAFKLDDKLTPIYPSIEGIQTGRLRNLVSQALNIMRTSQPNEYLPEYILKEIKMPSLPEALINLHQPPANLKHADINEAMRSYKERLSFEELLANYISLRQLKLLAANTTADSLQDGKNEVSQFVQALDFQLTTAQKLVYKEILADLNKPQPMMRMLQGDVGSGKTVVAAIACLKTIANKKQAAIMAPTELLTEQHVESFSVWFAKLNINIIKLTGGQKKSIRENNLRQIEKGEANLIIGTHALFQEGVIFKDLALIIIDEQHRFGVNQRVALREKGSQSKKQPHQLIMTATPIPRTLAMAAYADLDSSIIDELPVGRKPVETLVIPNDKRPSVIERVKDACTKGQQAYWVCPLIDESELIKADAATDRYEYLKKIIKPLKIGLIHGRQKQAEKENTMRLFKEGKIDLLVATTVIEVGVNVPNASLMIIENAERMGLTQLHQLRGRVGRGNQKSHCILLYKKPLGSLAHDRLSILRETNDGFVIAQRDLELRGPGELLGTKQTGLPQYRIADLMRDAHLLPKVQKIAETLMHNLPNKTKKIIMRWSSDDQHYGKV